MTTLSTLAPLSTEAMTKDDGWAERNSLTGAMLSNMKEKSSIMMGDGLTLAVQRILTHFCHFGNNSFYFYHISQDSKINILHLLKAVSTLLISLSFSTDIAKLLLPLILFLY